jgi:predicted metal-binding membrane protein
MPLRFRIAALVLGGALVAWIVTLERMRGMDAGPGTDLGGLGWFLGLWVTMMAAMMLPSAAPMALFFGHVSSAGRTAIFLAGYLVTWTIYGLVAFGLYRAIRGFDLGFLSWDEQGPLIAGAAIAFAGLYQLTPLKNACLRHCRAPLHFVRRRWRDGGVGALGMGMEHGLFCVGCCSGLMLILFALGAMSLVWMALIAGLIFAEKVLPFGGRLPALLAISFVLLGAWVAAAPKSVPGLTQPDEAPAMQMHPS